MRLRCDFSYIERRTEAYFTEWPSGTETQTQTLRILMYYCRTAEQQPRIGFPIASNKYKKRKVREDRNTRLFSPMIACPELTPMQVERREQIYFHSSRSCRWSFGVPMPNANLLLLLVNSTWRARLEMHTKCALLFANVLYGILDQSIWATAQCSRIIVLDAIEKVMKSIGLVWKKRRNTGLWEDSKMVLAKRIY